MFSSWFPASWTALHGAITHFPVAMLLGGAAFDIGATLRRKSEWRIVSFWMLALAVLMAIPSLATGWIAGGKLYGQSTLPPIFVWHRLLAFGSSGLALILLLWRTKARDYDNLSNIRGRGAIVFLSVLVAIAVGVTGHLGGQMVFGDDANGPAAIFPHAKNEPEDATKTAPSKTSGARPPQKATAPGSGFVPLDAKFVAQGQKLYVSESCNSCHQMDGKGGKRAPDLTHIGSDETSVQWHIEHLKNPRSKHPDSTMPAYDYLSAPELKALATFMVSRK